MVFGRIRYWMVTEVHHYHDDAGAAVLVFRDNRGMVNADDAPVNQRA